MSDFSMDLTDLTAAFRQEDGRRSPTNQSQARARADYQLPDRFEGKARQRAFSPTNAEGVGFANHFLQAGLQRQLSDSSLSRCIRESFAPAERVPLNFTQLQDSLNERVAALNALPCIGQALGLVLDHHDLTTGPKGVDFTIVSQGVRLGIDPFGLPLSERGMKKNAFIVNATRREWIGANRQAILEKLRGDHTGPENDIDIFRSVTWKLARHSEDPLLAIYRHKLWQMCSAAKSIETFITHTFPKHVLSVKSNVMPVVGVLDVGHLSQETAKTLVDLVLAEWRGHAQENGLDATQDISLVVLYHGNESDFDVVGSFSYITPRAAARILEKGRQCSHMVNDGLWTTASRQQADLERKALDH